MTWTKTKNSGYFQTESERSAWQQRVLSPLRLKRQKLTGKEQAAYDQIAANLALHKECFAIPSCLTGEAISRIYAAVHDDNPLLFHGNKGFSYVRTGISLFMRPAYRMGMEEHIAAVEEIEGAILHSNLPKAGDRPPMETLKILHDWLSASCSYGGTEAPDSHEMTGPILNGIAVCEGVARAFKYLCDLQGIPCWFVKGTSTTTGPNNGSVGGHAWNIVSLPLARGGERSFHVDVTFDLLDGGCGRPDYFCLSDEEISQDHTFEEDLIPSCPTRFNYYQATGRYAASASQLREIVRQEKKKGSTAIFLQIPRIEGAEPKEAAAQVAKIVQEAYRPRPFDTLCFGFLPYPNISYRFNPSRMTFAFFIESPSKGGLQIA